MQTCYDNNKRINRTGGFFFIHPQQQRIIALFHIRCPIYMLCLHLLRVCHLESLNKQYLAVHFFMCLFFMAEFELIFLRAL